MEKFNPSKTSVFALSRKSFLDTLIPLQTGNNMQRAKDLFRSVYLKHEASFHAAGLNKELAARLEAIIDLNLPLTLHSENLSEADGSIKFVFRLSDGALIESVLIPERNRNTLCISTQYGCAQACRFCHTGTMGLLRNLKTEEIVAQVVYANRWLVTREQFNASAPEPVVRNVVFMGMGEPLDNFDAVRNALPILTDGQGLRISPNRLTVSTVGLMPQLQQLLEHTMASVALSIHSPFEEQRTKLMPVNTRSPLHELIGYLKAEGWKHRKHFFVQYLLLRNLNDSEEHALALAKLLQGVPAKINLIPYNEHNAAAFRRPDLMRVDSFQKTLKAAGFTTTVRLSKGRDVGAACGQLVTNQNQ